MSESWCKVSGKRQYASRPDAQRVADGQMARWKNPPRRADKRPARIRVYRCPYCNQWHVTTAEYIPAVASNRLRRDIRRGLIEQQ